MGCGIVKEITKIRSETFIKYSSNKIPSRILKMHHNITKIKKTLQKLKTIQEVSFKFEQSL